MNDGDHKDLAEAREVCPTTSRQMLKNGALLVDVREPAEVAEVGFADCDLMLIPMSQLEARWPEIPRDRDVILACAVGQRSLKATYFLMYQGYERVANMQYGLKRWAQRGFPVTGDIESSGTETGAACCDDSPEAVPDVRAASCCGEESGTKSCC